MAEIARRIVLGWFGGTALGVVIGVPAAAKPPLKRGTFLYSDAYTDRYNG